MKIKILIVAIAIVLIGAVIVLRPDTDGSETTYEPENVSTSTPPISFGAREYTLAEIASHDDAQSCYTAIDGSVYDLTKWIEVHPGGAENILLLCGIDGTTAFNEQHGTSDVAKSRLASLKIGTLK